MKKIFYTLVFISTILVLSFNTVIGQDKEILEKAKKGNADAQFELGNMYYFGEGVKVDYKKAFYWTKKSAENGKKLAFFNLSKMY